MSQRIAREFEVLISEGTFQFSREGGYASPGSHVLAADVVVHDQVPAVPATVVGAAAVANPVRAGTFHLNGQAVTVTGGATTPAQLVALVNGIAGIGLVASLSVTGKLSLVSADTVSDIVVADAGNTLSDAGLTVGTTNPTAAVPLDTWVPLTAASLGQVSSVAIALNNEQGDQKGFAMLARHAEVKDLVVRWPEDAAVADIARAALRSKGIVARA